MVYYEVQLVSMLFFFMLTIHRFLWHVSTGSTSKNIHIQEERGQMTSSLSMDWDEEDRFSGVGIIGKVDDNKLQSSPVKVRNSTSEGGTRVAIDFNKSASASCTAPESDQRDCIIEKKKEAHKLNADAAEWKPPSHFTLSNVSGSKPSNQAQTVVSEYPSFSSVNLCAGLHQVASRITIQVILFFD